MFWVLPSSRLRSPVSCRNSCWCTLSAARVCFELGCLKVTHVSVPRACRALVLLDGDDTACYVHFREKVHSLHCLERFHFGADVSKTEALNRDDTLSTGRSPFTEHSTRTCLFKQPPTLTYHLPWRGNQLTTVIVLHCSIFSFPFVTAD